MRTVSYSRDLDGLLIRTTAEYIEACSNGHPFTPANTVIRRGGKQGERLVCRTCERSRSREHKRRLAIQRYGRA